MEDIELQFDEDAIDYIVEKAMDFKLGARGLRSICEAIMTDAMYDAPSEDHKEPLVITKAYAMEKIEKSKLAKLRAA